MPSEALTADDFWASIEAAWDGIADDGARARLLTAGSDSERTQAASALDAHHAAFFTALRAILDTYSAPQLAAWDAHCERALYDLDRQDVHDALDGSDDGFLYARGFVVLAGRAYFDAVNADPGAAGVMDAEAERMCYIAAHEHDRRFGTWPPETGISRETGSNPSGGWQ